MWLGLSGPFPRQVLADYRPLPRQGEAADRPRRRRDHRGRLPRAQRPHLGRRRRARRQEPDRHRRHRRRSSASTSSCRPAASKCPGREVNVRVLGEAVDLETLRQHRRPRRRGLPGLPLRRRPGRGRLRGHPPLRARQRRAGPGPRHPQAARRQRRGGRPGRQGRHGRDPGDPARGHEARHQLRLDHASSRTRSTRSSSSCCSRSCSPPLVCWLFLGSFSSTLNVVLAIPMSLLGTVAVIYFLGFTLNTFTLLALGAGGRHRRRRRDHGAREHLPPRRGGRRPRHRGARGHRARSPSPRSRRPSPSAPSSCRSSS